MLKAICPTAPDEGMPHIMILSAANCLTWIVRMCVGKDLANQTLFIDFATLLWTCNIDKAIGADGNSITPSRTDFVDEGVVMYVQLVQQSAR